MKMVFAFISVLSISALAFATGGLTCISKDSKLRFDIVESSDARPVSAKVYYKTDAIDGEDGSVNSFDLRNSELTRPILYSEAEGFLVVVFLTGNSVISAKLNLSTMKGKAQAMVSGDTKTKTILCVRE